MKNKILAYRFDSQEQKQDLLEYYGSKYFSYIPYYTSTGWLFSQDSVKDTYLRGCWSSKTVSEAKQQKDWKIISFKQAIKNSPKNMKSTNSELQKGDTVSCVKATGSSFLRTWKNYILHDQNAYGNWQVAESETGALSAHWYKPERFSLLKKANNDAVKTAASNFLSKSFKTRCGYEVQIMSVASQGGYPVLGQYYDPVSKNWLSAFWTITGQHHASTHLDLVEKKAPTGLGLSKSHAAIYEDRVELGLYKEPASIVLTKQDLQDIMKQLN